MIQTIKQNKKAVLAFLLALVMLIGIIPFTATEVQAVTIPVGDITTNDSFGNGDAWVDGDELYFCRVSKDNQWAEYTLTANVEDEVTTWTPSEKLYWDDKGEHKLVVNYPADTGWVWDTWYILEDQSTLEKLKRADHMNAMWKGNPTTDPINLNLKHRLSMVTVTYTFASEFANEPDIAPEVYSNTQYMLFDINTLERRNVEWQEDHAIWVKPYQHKGENDEKQFTAIISPDAYSAGDEFIRITIGDQVLTAKMKEDITFEEGTHYTFDLKVGKDKVTIEQVSVNGNDPSIPFGDGWRSDTEEDLGAVSITDTQDEGKTAWDDGDQIIATLTSQRYGEQTAMLTFSGSDGTWSTDESFSYLENETPTVKAIYAPSNILGTGEYIEFDCELNGAELTVKLESATRNYSRLRIVGLPNQTLTVTTMDFTPAGATEAGEHTYTLTTDNNGNAFLYGVFAEGATVSVKQDDVVLKEYAFTAEKFPGGTEQGKSYVLGVVLGDITDAKAVSTGDIALSDGSFVSNAEIANMTAEQKAAAVGIVFWTTKDTDSTGRTYPASLTDDKVMNTDFPQCVNGLIVSLKNLDAMQWQASEESVFEVFQSQNNEFNPSTSDYVSIKQSNNTGGGFYQILGYQSTKVLQAYNEYCKANGKDGYIMNPVAKLGEFATSNPAPFGSTGWYLPSAKELSILCNGDVDEIWNYVQSKDNMQTINSILELLNADLLGSYHYWGSMEGDEDQGIACDFSDGKIKYPRKIVPDYHVRYICAF